LRVLHGIGKRFVVQFDLQGSIVPEVTERFKRLG
jgi:hypothetical protein